MQMTSLRAWIVLLFWLSRGGAFQASSFTPSVQQGRRRQKISPVEWSLSLHRHQQFGDLNNPAEPETLEIVLRETNKERRHEGLFELQLNDELCQAAQKHAEDMARSDFFSHTSINDGTRCADRVMRHTNYRFQAVGENLYVSFPDNRPYEAVLGWMKSTAHRDNLLGETFRDIGLGYAVSHKQQKHYYVQVFGNPLLIPIVNGRRDTLQSLLGQANHVRRLAGLSDLLPCAWLERVAQHHAWKMMQSDSINIPCDYNKRQMKMDGFQQLSFQSSFREPFNDPFAVFAENYDERVLLQPEFTTVGFGYATRGDRHYYMMILGQPAVRLGRRPRRASRRTRLAPFMY